MSSGPASRARLVRDVIVVIAVTLVTAALHHMGWLDRFETASLDAFNVVAPERTPRHVVIVGIHDADYHDQGLFRGTSPLDCQALRRVLDAVASGRPAVIGVDLDTSSPGFDCLRPDPAWPPIVWVQDTIPDSSGTSFSGVPAAGGARNPPRPIDGFGLGLVPQDADGVIRRYYRELPLGDGRAGWTFPWAVVHAACRAGCTACCDTVRRAAGDERHPLRLNFAGERYTFEPLSVRHVLQAAGGEAAAGWRERGPLVGRIVLLGGTYRAARDAHATPVGTMAGVQIMAQAIESDIEGGGIRNVNAVVAMAFDLALGFLIVWIHHRLHDRVTLATVLSLVGLPVLCVLASYLAFSTLGLWFSFVAVAASVLIHQLYERARENQRLRGGVPLP